MNENKKRWKKNLYERLKLKEEKITNFSQTKDETNEKISTRKPMC